MATDVKIPTLGESITEATITTWFKKVGDPVAVDEALAELETDKVTIELPSPISGILTEILVQEGEDVDIGALACRITKGDAPAQAEQNIAKEEAQPAKQAEVAKASTPTPASIPSPQAQPATNTHLSPAVAKHVAENNLDPKTILATGPKGNITKGDVLNLLKSPVAIAPVIAPATKERPLDPRGEERVKMSRLRKVIATRLKQAQNNAAMLTTFNEADLTKLMETRANYKESFEKRYGVRLGFMSFFVKACVNALKQLPSVNAEIYGDEIIYKNFYDIGIAVGTPQGLVVPILRDADKKSFAEIEATIADFGKRARDGKIKMEDMQGGTFTITNGGVFGSLLSTPIINPPQSGILGMHKIQKRPMVDKNNDIYIANMMYLAHSYDHRIIDGREAVTFLVKVKEQLEDPTRLLIDV